MEESLDTIELHEVCHIDNAEYRFTELLSNHVYKQRVSRNKKIQYKDPEFLSLLHNGPAHYYFPQISFLLSKAESIGQTAKAQSTDQLVQTKTTENAIQETTQA